MMLLILCCKLLIKCINLNKDITNITSDILTEEKNLMNFLDSALMSKIFNDDKKMFKRRLIRDFWKCRSDQI